MRCQNKTQCTVQWWYNKLNFTFYFCCLCGRCTFDFIAAVLSFFQLSTFHSGFMGKFLIKNACGWIWKVCDFPMFINI